MGSYTNAALEGFGDETYTDAALKGFGDESYTDAALKGFGDETYTNAALRGCGKFKKGSAEAKAYMARIRAMRGKGGSPCRAGKRKLKGGIALAAIGTALSMIPTAIRAAKGIYKGIKWLIRGGKDEGGFAIDSYAPPQGYAKKLGKKASGSGWLADRIMRRQRPQLERMKKTANVLRGITDGIRDYAKKKKLERTAEKINELTKSEGEGCMIPMADLIKKYGKGWI